jgi:hypothetical protein
MSHDHQILLWGAQHRTMLLSVHANCGAHLAIRMQARIIYETAKVVSETHCPERAVEMLYTTADDIVLGEYQSLWDWVDDGERPAPAKPAPYIAHIDSDGQPIAQHAIPPVAGASWPARIRANAALKGAWWAAKSILAATGALYLLASVVRH